MRGGTSHIRKRSASFHQLKLCLSIVSVRSPKMDRCHVQNHFIFFAGLLYALLTIFYALLNSQCCIAFQGVGSPLFTNDMTSEVAVKKVLIFEPDQKKRLDIEAEIMKAPQRG